MIWLIPPAILLVAVVPILVAVRRLSSEVADLRRELTAFGDARTGLVELRREVRGLAGGVPEMRLRTRPAPPAAS